MKLSCIVLSSIAMGLLVLAGCASGRYKERQAEREKVAAATGMFCEFVNGDANPDVDVEMNFQMGKRCDSTKPFSITAYKNPSEIHGVIYCCSMKQEMPKGLPAKAPGTTGFAPATSAAAKSEPAKAVEPAKAASATAAAMPAAVKPADKPKAVESKPADTKASEIKDDTDIVE